MPITVKCAYCKGDMYIDDFVYRLDADLLCSRSCIYDYVLDVGMAKGILLAEEELDGSVE